MATPRGQSPTLPPPQVVPFEPRFREGVRQLLTAAYGSPLAFDRFAEGNPLGPFLAACAVRDDQVVGFNIWNPWLIHGAAGPVVTFQSGASIVDHSCRGQGVFAKLLACGETLARSRGIKYFVGFPNPASHGSFVRAGWETVRSMSLYVCASPALGLRAGPARPGSSDAWRFIEWRYSRAGARSVSATVAGEPFTVFFTTTSRRGAKVHRVLDVLDASGRRDLRVVGRVATALPGPGAAYLRASSSQSSGLPQVPWLVPVRREWDTPYIVKVLDASNPVEADSVRGALLAYGDIDVGG